MRSELETEAAEREKTEEGKVRRERKMTRRKKKGGGK